MCNLVESKISWKIAVIYRAHHLQSPGGSFVFRCDSICRHFTFILHAGRPPYVTQAIKYALDRCVSQHPLLWKSVSRMLNARVFAEGGLKWPKQAVRIINRYYKVICQGGSIVACMAPVALSLRRRKQPGCVNRQSNITQDGTTPNLSFIKPLDDRLMTGETNGDAGI